MNRLYKLDCEVVSIEIDTDPSGGNGCGTRTIFFRFRVDGLGRGRAVTWPTGVPLEVALDDLLSRVEQDVKTARGDA